VGDAAQEAKREDVTQEMQRELLHVDHVDIWNGSLDAGGTTTKS
jgi:hypothetical protein